jgi:polyhomeotic-like protein 3
MFFFCVLFLETLEEMDSELLKCEFCGKMEYASEFLQSKRFCLKKDSALYHVSKGTTLAIPEKFALSRWNHKPDNQNLGFCGII